MDFLKNAVGGNAENTNTGTTAQGTQPLGGQQQQGGGMMDKMNSALGGGQASEKNEDYLDKGVDFVQERMGGGAQNNESALEQAKDEQISDAIRGGYKSTTGKDFFVADKS